jgi:nitrogen regulatory protein P-II 1
MREIKAYLRVFMVGNVVRALKHEGFHRVTVLDVSAVSDPIWGEERELNATLGLHTRMAKLELICRDEDVDTVLRVIRASAHTGNPGDGIVCVSEVRDCMCIRTGERGISAL